MTKVINARSHFRAAAAFEGEAAEWAQRVSGPVQLVSSPAAVLIELDGAETVLVTE